VVVFVAVGIVGSSPPHTPLAITTGLVRTLSTSPRNESHIVHERLSSPRASTLPIDPLASGIPTNQSETNTLPISLPFQILILVPLVMLMILLFIFVLAHFFKLFVVNINTWLHVILMVLSIILSACAFVFQLTSNGLTDLTPS
jgi:hypothetical protein